MRRDVTVVVPAALNNVRDLQSLKANDPASYLQELERKISELLLAAQENKIAMDTFTNVIASLVKIANDQMGGRKTRAGEIEVMLPRTVSDRMDGSKVTISEAPGTRDVIVRIREGAPHPLWEGRHG